MKQMVCHNFRIGFDCSVFWWVAIYDIYITHTHWQFTLTVYCGQSLIISNRWAIFHSYVKLPNGIPTYWIGHTYIYTIIYYIITTMYIYMYIYMLLYYQGKSSICLRKCLLHTICGLIIFPRISHELFP